MRVEECSRRYLAPHEDGECGEITRAFFCALRKRKHVPDDRGAFRAQSDAISSSDVGFLGQF